jgi:hypothetical protein
MQTLYYTSASASLTVVQANTPAQYWYSVDNLIVCSSQYQVVAKSGSTELIRFPINDTVIYYSDEYTSSYDIPQSTSSASFSPLTIRFTIETPVTEDSSSYRYYVTGSNTSISGSEFSSGLGTSVNGEASYTFGLSGSGDYEAYIYVTDPGTPSPTPEVGYIVVQTSASNSEATVTAYLSGSRSYNVIYTIIGTLPPP